MVSVLRFHLFVFLAKGFVSRVGADPISKPYVAYRTNPIDSSARVIQESEYDLISQEATPIDIHLNQCASPLSIQIRHSTVHTSTHLNSMSTSGRSNPVISKPVIYPLHSHGPNQSIIVLHFHELLDVVNFGNFNHEEHSFPLIFQGSTFLSSPIITDVNLDGKEDAILVDYNGVITIVGLHTTITTEDYGISSTKANRRHRFYREIKLPKLFLREEWVSYAINTTAATSFEQRYNLSPFHGYFQYFSGATATNTKISEGIIRGEKADILHQNYHVVNTIEEERRKIEQNSHFGNDRVIDINKSFKVDNGMKRKKEIDLPDDYNQSSQNEINPSEADPSIISKSKQNRYYQYDDDFFQSFDRDSFYDDHYSMDHDGSPYVSVPPHVLSTPTFFQNPNNNVHADGHPIRYHEEYLAISVSYYFDEDDQDQNNSDVSTPPDEILRGQYVASALVIYDIRNNSFLHTIHLDLSTDYSAPLSSGDDSKDASWHSDEQKLGMIALALASPTAVDLNGDGIIEILVGTSMGNIYCIGSKSGEKIFSVQMSSRIEHPIVADDLITEDHHGHLEVVAIDSTANVLFLNSHGETIWEKKLFAPTVVGGEGGVYNGVQSTSGIVITDINQDNRIDIVVSVIADESLHIFALDARDGNSLDGYPKKIFVENIRLYSNSTLNPIVTDSLVIQALGSHLYIFDTYSDCVHRFDLYNPILSLESGDADGDGMMDLVVSTTKGLVSLDTTLILSRNIDGCYGVRIDQSILNWHTILSGYKIPVQFTIFDCHAKRLGNSSTTTYPIEMLVSKSLIQTIFRKEYEQDGTHIEHVYFPFPSGFYSVTVRMNLNGKLFEDTLHFGFHVNSSPLTILKWCIIVPLCLCLLATLFLKPMSKHTEPLRALNLD